MFVIIDVEVTYKHGYFPTPENNDIIKVDTISTNFDGCHQYKSVTPESIDKIKGELENNVLITFCYDFESSFLNKYGIYPKRHIDLNKLLGFGTLERCCDLSNIPFNKDNICETIYKLSCANLDKILKVR